ncbi:MAG: outer membrane protein assembly factor BamA [Candidatus Omnitrophota bacterium]
MKKILIAAALSVLTALAVNVTVTMDASAQGDSEGKTITDLRVKGNKAISKETIISKVKAKVGDLFNNESLNDDLRRLYATEYFTDVSIDVEDHEKGIAVTFIVKEKSVVGDIIFEGNRAVRDTKLKSLMKTKPNEMLNQVLLAQDMVDIKDFYVKKGYPSIDVKYSVDVDEAVNKATVTVTVDEKSRVKVAKITITGNKAVKTGRIVKFLATKPAWLFNSGVFKDDLFQEDLEKIKSVYDDEGFLDVEAVPRMEYSEDGKLLYITIEVREGKQYKAGNVAVKGNLVLPESDIVSKMKLRSGMPFSNKTLRGDVVAVRQHYYHYGYMNASIDIDKNLNAATGDIDVTYIIDAKELVYVGKVEVRGNTKTKDIVVRRELRLYPGDKFDGEKIRRSKERLYNLGIFEDIGFDAEPTSNPETQDLVVSVKEGKTGEFSFGGGYSSVDQLLGFVEVSQRNFDILNFPTFTGAGQSMTVKAEIGMTRANYDVSWTEPWILGYPVSLGLDFYQTSHRKELDIGWPYDEQRTGGDVRLGKEFTEYLRGDAMYKLEQIHIGDVVENASQDLKDESGTNMLSSMLFQLTLDTRDNIYNPGRGYVINGSIEDAGGIFFGDKDYVKGTATAAYYHTFFDKFVLELKGRAGLENAYGDSDEVPIYERFFGGGANTIRGYKERKVGPRDPGSNDPIGGEAIVVGNAEVTFPIYENVLKGAIFYDVGNVWRRAEDFIVGGGYKHGIGIGVRVKTPIGPVSLDYGYPLVKNFEDEKTGEFYFKMSRGF